MSSLHRGRSFCHLYHWWGGESTVLVGSCQNCFRTAEPVYAVLYEIFMAVAHKGSISMGMQKKEAHLMTGLQNRKLSVRPCRLAKWKSVNWKVQT